MNGRRRDRTNRAVTVAEMAKRTNELQRIIIARQLVKRNPA